MKSSHVKKLLAHDRVLLAVATAFGLWLRSWLLPYFQSPFYLIAHVPDDAYYYFAIAKNMALGHSITIDGIHATNGMHPLWLVIIAPFFSVFPGNHYFDAVQAVLIFQLVLD